MQVSINRRLLAASAGVLTAAACAGTGLTLAPSSYAATHDLPAATAPGNPIAATAAGTWLRSQLDSTGAMPGFAPGSPDVGLTIDTYWAMKAAGAPKAQLAKTWAAISSHAQAYAGPQVYSGVTYITAGASAKVLFAAATAGVSPILTQPSGYKLNILNQTLALVNQKPGPEHGRLQDPAADGPDSSNIFSQSLAVLGFVGVHEEKTTKRAVVQDAVNFLLTQQCSAGYFRMFYNDNLSCNAARPEGNAQPDNDGTSMGLQALMAAKAAGLAVPESAITHGTAYLVSAQKANGSFGGGVSTEAPNSNSTGLAAATLQAAGQTHAAAKAGAWMTTVQAMLPRIKGTPLAADAGAIAYDQPTFAAALKSGIGSTVGVWQRATPQAIFAFARVPFIDLVGTTITTKPTPTPTPTKSSPRPTPSHTTTPKSTSPAGPTATSVRPTAASSTTSAAGVVVGGSGGGRAAAGVAGSNLIAGAAPQGATGDAAPTATASATTSASVIPPASSTSTPRATGQADVAALGSPSSAQGGGTNEWPLAIAIVVGALAAGALLLTPRLLKKEG